MKAAGLFVAGLVLGAVLVAIIAAAAGAWHHESSHTGGGGGEGSSSKAKVCEAASVGLERW